MEEKILQFSKIIGVDISGSLISACICEYSLDNHSVTCCEPHFVRATPSFSREKYDKNFETYLEDFGNQLGSLSREFFSPYPWADQQCAQSAFEEAIERSLNGTEVSYIMLLEARPIAHFILWGTAAIREFKGSLHLVRSLSAAEAPFVGYSVNFKRIWMRGMM